MIILDASVLIAHRDPDDAHHEPATRLLLDHVDEDFGASVITMAECLVGPTRVQQQERFQKFLDQLGVTVIPLDRSAGAVLATLRAQTSLKMPDCCVMAAARACAGHIATFDERLRAAGNQIGVPVLSPG